MELAGYDRKLLFHHDLELLRHKKSYVSGTIRGLSGSASNQERLYGLQKLTSRGARREISTRRSPSYDDGMSRSGPLLLRIRVISYYIQIKH